MAVTFFEGRPGECLVLFANERGKGDHAHIGEIENRYGFVSVEKLTADFLSEVRRLRSKKER